MDEQLHDFIVSAVAAAMKAEADADYVAPPGLPGPEDDPLEAMEQMMAKKKEFSAIEWRLRKLGGALQTWGEFERWCRLCYQLGSHPRRVCDRLSARFFSDEQVLRGADADWIGPDVAPPGKVLGHA